MAKITESFLAIKWVTSENRGVYQSSFSYRGMLNGQWHDVNKNKANKGLFRPLGLCSWGWHALPLSNCLAERTSYDSTVTNTPWLVEMFGDVVWGSDKFCTSEIRFVEKLTTGILASASARSGYGFSAERGESIARELKLEGLVLVAIKGSEPPLYRVKPEFRRL